MDRYEWLTSLYLQINHTRIKRLQAFFRIREVGVTANKRNVTTNLFGSLNIYHQEKCNFL